jgi:hypothetical protein
VIGVSTGTDTPTETVPPVVDGPPFVSPAPVAVPPAPGIVPLDPNVPTVPPVSGHQGRVIVIRASTRIIEDLLTEAFALLFADLFAFGTGLLSEKISINLL